MMHNWYGHGSNLISQGNFWWMGVASMIIHLLFWGVVIFLAVKFLKKYLERADRKRVNEDSAMMILRERFAKGEIELEEFKQRKAELEQANQSK
ncbi:MAG: hypothetical protein GX434_04850 [Peptococcaceae bacterium]|nr:hypothetical protein [Peptococcaceae bacterium]